LSIVNESGASLLIGLFSLILLKKPLSGNLSPDNPPGYQEVGGPVLEAWAKNPLVF
jgi:hypothetical protein